MKIRVLYFVGRALLKEDRPTFALHLVHGMHPELFQPVRVLQHAVYRIFCEQHVISDRLIEMQVFRRV